MRRVLRALGDLSLSAKVSLTLALVFAAVVTALLLLLLPFLRQQRERLLAQDRRLLVTLRASYERDFIYDLLSENRDSLVVHLADLAGQQGVLWVRVEAPGFDLAATARRETQRALVGAEAERLEDEPGVVLLVERGSAASLIGSGGRPLVSGRRIEQEALPRWTPPAGAGAFQERRVDGEGALHYVAELSAAGESFGRLHLLYSLAAVERAESLTRRLFYGVVGGAFALLLLVLNLLVAQIVIAPLRRVRDALGQAATGDLEVRLPVHSRDELGAIATSFNRMAGELAASKREVEGYSRNLEAMVAVRTRELRDSESSLLALKNHLATVLATVATGVIAVDDASRVETFNERARAILGLGPEPVEGRPLEEVLRGELRPLLRAVEPVLARERERHEDRVECRVGQARRTLSVIASALVGERGQHVGVVVACEDLTRILATQRLEAWREAVERVIHEIKNPLTPVGLAAETLRTAWGDDRERFARVFPSAIEMILGSVRDLKQLIEEFSRFSRLPAPRPTRLDLNALVREATAAYAEAPKAAVEVVLELAAELPRIEADADQLRRVLLNVVNNALEAMAGRPGRIVVRTERRATGVAIAVLDEGPGVEDGERVFEPHFSTKAKGTGLGLTIARQIVEEHGGAIQVRRRDPVGTAVVVELPAVSDG